MHRSRLNLLFVLLLAAGLTACESELDQQPAAEVGSARESSPAPDASNDTAPATSVEVIKEQSAIEWVGRRVTRDHQGGFREFDGRLTHAGGRTEGVEFDIDLRSIWSDTDRLTEHLKSADFFEVQKYPTAHFRSTSIEPATDPASGETHIVTGVLDLHGVQKEVRFPVKVEPAAEGVRTTASFTINRQDWGISYPGAPDDLIRDEVLIKLNLLFPTV
ncbi:MAG TPA: YceI family protein [Thermoanaerobaculia bacterium]|nr:YceI family protein [Thermoanaerobaculia bacterium]